MINQLGQIACAAQVKSDNVVGMMVLRNTNSTSFKVFGDMLFPLNLGNGFRVLCASL